MVDASAVFHVHTDPVEVTAVAQSAILLGAVREGLGERSDLIGGKVVVVHKVCPPSPQ